jgi:branched-chain amino acid transport system substrate-binding protein
MKRLIIVCTLLLISTLIFSSCSSTSTSTTSSSSSTVSSTSASTGPTEIHLGTAAPLTGAMATLGQGTVFGLNAAINDINSQGGVYVADLGKKLSVTLTTLDSQSDPTRAATLAESLIVSDKVDFIISGDEVPPDVATMGPVAEKHSMPFIISPGPLEPFMGIQMAMSKPFQYVWGMGFSVATEPPAGDFRAGIPGYMSSRVEGAGLGPYADRTNKVVALGGVDDSDGRNWYSQTGPVMQQQGFTIVGFNKELGLTPENTTDFTSVIQEWISSKAEILETNSSAPWLGTLLRQSAAMGFQPKFILAGKAGMYYEDVSSWGGELPNGVCSSIMWFPTYNTPGIGSTTPKTLNDAWTKQTGQPFNQGIGHGYAVAQILFDAIQRAGSLDHAKVNAAIGQTDLMTINDRVVFDPATHFSMEPVIMTQWQKSSNPQFKWEQQVVVSLLDSIKTTGTLMFPIQYNK